MIIDLGPNCGRVEESRAHGRSCAALRAEIYYRMIGSVEASDSGRSQRPAKWPRVTKTPEKTYAHLEKL